MNLFKEKPTIDFYPEVSGGNLKVFKSRGKNVVTLDIGLFCNGQVKTDTKIKPPFLDIALSHMP